MKHHPVGGMAKNQRQVSISAKSTEQSQHFRQYQSNSNSHRDSGLFIKDYNKHSFKINNA